MLLVRFFFYIDISSSYFFFFFFFKQKTAYEMRISDWSSDVCSSDLYHEIQQPYEFLWRLRPSLAATGEVIVVDADRVPQNHGMPPKLLECEFAAVGYKLVEMREMPSAGGYSARFRPVGPPPPPDATTPTRFVHRSPRTRPARGIDPP